MNLFHILLLLHGVMCHFVGLFYYFFQWTICGGNRNTHSHIDFVSLLFVFLLLLVFFFALVSNRTVVYITKHPVYMSIVWEKSQRAEKKKSYDIKGLQISICCVLCMLCVNVRAVCLPARQYIYIILSMGICYKF